MRSQCVLSLPTHVQRLSRRLLSCQAAEPTQDVNTGVRKKIKNVAKKAMQEMLEKQPEDTLRLVVDCNLHKYYKMSEKELKDLARQINSCYGNCLRSPRPCLLHLTGLEEEGVVETALKNHFIGYESSSLLMKQSAKMCTEEFNRKDLVYLSPYSRSALQDVKSHMVYVVGAMVDKSAAKMISESAARDLGIPTARLPIREHMIPAPDTSPHRLDLPIDIVVKMLISVCHHGDWNKALDEHLPKRKGWVLRNAVTI